MPESGNDQSAGPRQISLEAARTLFLAAGFESEVIEQAFRVLLKRELKTQDENPLLSAKEVCEWLGVSYTTLWRLNIPHVKLNRIRRFCRSDVQRFLESRRKGRA
jgi:excisionase family DNA binding protein